MEDQKFIAEGSCNNNSAVEQVKMEEEEEEFRSCCGEDGEGEEREESLKDEDESTVKMYFKGISVDGFGESGSGLVGIGVVFEGSVACVQKRLDFYVEDSVAEYLALMDGLAEASKNNVRRVIASTDSKVLYEQIMLEELQYNPLMSALTERVLELAATLEAFSLKLVSSLEVERASQLAQVAIGLVSLDAITDSPLENCSICCENKPSSMMLTLRCLHKFCSHCLKTYADGKIQASQVPIKCPQLRCKYFISTSECKMFLPVISYEVLERKIAEYVLSSEKMYCPYKNCSALLDPGECISAQASSSCESNNSCIECPVCQRSICVDCVVPWHNSLSCEEYQELPLQERDASDISLYRLAQDRRWRRCQQCWRMIELTQGCYHLTCCCRCGHEFCYSCGAEYRDDQQTCQCAFWDEDTSEDSASPSTPEADHWPWNSFDTIPMILDAYSDQERSQLALIQRFLAGGFSLSDHSPYQSPPHCTDSYVDAMKDLHQLPWLERFVSVISDNYYDDYIH